MDHNTTRELLKTELLTNGIPQVRGSSRTGRKRSLSLVFSQHAYVGSKLEVALCDVASCCVAGPSKITVSRPSPFHVPRSSCNIEVEKLALSRLLGSFAEQHGCSCVCWALKNGPARLGLFGLSKTQHFVEFALRDHTPTSAMQSEPRGVF